MEFKDPATQQVTILNEQSVNKLIHSIDIFNHR